MPRGNFADFFEGEYTNTNSELDQVGGYLGQTRILTEDEWVTAGGAEGEGDKLLILVKHINAVTVLVGHVACLDVVTEKFDVTNDRSLGTGRACGFYISVPAENDYCWLLIKGYLTDALTDGGVSAGDKVFAHATTDGGLDTAVDTTASTPLTIVGTAMADDATNALELYVNSEVFA